MNTTCFSFVLLLTAGLASATNTFAVESPAKTEPRKEAPGASPAEAVIAQSIFDASANLKDPFHPKSIRRPGLGVVEPIKSDTSASDLASMLVLKGLSGQASHRLAVINGRTLAVGEEDEITTPRGKVKIRCLEIRSASVVVAVGLEGTKVELKLRE
jgi:hypothetical protein